MAYGLQTIFEESVSQITATPSVSLGTRRIEGGNEYIYAYNANATAAVGRGVIASCNSGYSFSVTTAAGNPLMGVVQNTDFTAAYYGWLLIRGLARSLPSTGAAAAGTAICLGTDGAFEAVATALAGGTAVACGASLGITSGSTGSAWIQATI